MTLNVDNAVQLALDLLKNFQKMAEKLVRRVASALRSPQKEKQGYHQLNLKQAEEGNSAWKSLSERVHRRKRIKENGQKYRDDFESIFDGKPFSEDDPEDFSGEDEHEYLSFGPLADMISSSRGQLAQEISEADSTKIQTIYNLRKGSILQKTSNSPTTFPPPTMQVFHRSPISHTPSIFHTSRILYTPHTLCISSELGV
ncbi:hypothetical protein M422DRAFT_780265 [Sphaerobolus stellatus SS14]|uniref:Uncharacterized protein n=1 Tax=Sphaerobolus stellatus (strain SS14) TaxID=990650 RepID=A0A0C9VTM1_SPHS4|nr:hypothetical protein M422DRAFT_780265 [Sphaerobolus stellatus SS14]